MSSMASTSKTAKYVVLAVVIAAVAVCAYVFWQSRFNILPQVIANVTSRTNRSEFPDIDTSTLSEDQQTILAILKDEYEANPAGTKYSEGIVEPWCADFVSWVYNEADLPYSNPNSGSWRIPGTYTLREYYEQSGRFVPAESSYTPQLGDTMLYDNPSTFGQHVNIVLAVNDASVTTIGGNEQGVIRITTHDVGGAGFVGYGVL